MPCGHQRRLWEHLCLVDTNAGCGSIYALWTPTPAVFTMLLNLGRFLGASMPCGHQRRLWEHLCLVDTNASCVHNAAESRSVLQLVTFTFLVL